MAGRRAQQVRVTEEHREPSRMTKFAVLAVVREALFEMPERASQVAIGHRRRQIMAHAFPYVDVAKVSEDELLDQLRDDIATAMKRLD